MNMELFLPRLEKGGCPSPARSTLELMELLQQESSGLNDAIKLIRLDPVLSAKIIKVANTPLYRNTRPVASLDEALMRIGLQVVVRLTLGLSLTSQKILSAPHFDLQRFWSTSVLRAIAMQALARQVGQWPAGDVFIFGLLSEIGSLLMACTAPEQSAAVAEDNAPLHRQLEREKMLFGFDRHELSAALMRQWRLPELMIAALESRQRPCDLRAEDALSGRTPTLIAILEAGRSISEWALTPTSIRSLESLQAEAKGWWLNTPHLEETIKLILVEWAVIADIFEQSPAEPELQKLELVRSTLMQLRSAPERKQPAPILLVDDQVSDRALLQRTLEPAGYRTIQASSADEAFTVIYKHNPRIIIVDWIMPEISGLDLCRRLRREFGPRLYLLILTAHYDQSYAAEALEAGANDYLSKPIARNILLAKLSIASQMIEFMSALESNCEQLIQDNNSLQSLAMKDALTGLANRRGADAFLNNHWLYAQRHQQTLSAIMLDIDNFKKINDQYGHDQGDLVLAALGKQLLETSRIGDLTARVGGEEFLIVCLQCDQENAMALAERLREAVAQLQGDFPHITISAGVAEMQTSMANPEALLRAADQALLSAKRQGRNQVVCAPPKST